MKQKRHDLSNPKGLPFYTDPELNKIIRTAGELRKDPFYEHAANFTLLMLATGARVNEAAQTQVKDCYDNYLHIPAENTKTKVARDVEISPELVPWYQEFVRNAQDRVFLFPAFARTRKTKFRDRNLVPVSRWTAMRWWCLIIEKAGVRFLTSHAARKSFATWESERLSVFDLKDQLGHASINTTEKYYRGSIPGRRWNKETPGFRETMKLI